MLISKRSGFKRTSGFYGHLPLSGYAGYLVYVFPKRGRLVLWYMGNPYRPGKIIEWQRQYQLKSGRFTRWS